MTGILDRVARSHLPTIERRRYRPATPEHVFALTLSKRLDDASAVQHYVELCDRYSQEVLLAAYRSVTKSGGTTDLGRRFNAAIQQTKGDVGSLPLADLAAIRIERRGIAVAIFRGMRLKYPPVAHQLSSDGNKALGSAALFISRLREKCTFSSAALELLPDGEAQRSQLATIIGEVLLQAQVAVHRFAKRDVLAAFGQPPLTFRRQVREVIEAIWPDVNGSYGGPLIKDALALGLYAQTERLFQQ